MAVYVSISGNLTKDPELKDIGNQKCCAFTVATRTHAKVKDGVGYKTDYYDCSYFGKMGEHFYNRAQKGTGVTVWGALATDVYTVRGEARPSLRVKVDSAECMARMKDSSSSETPVENVNDVIPF